MKKIILVILLTTLCSISFSQYYEGYEQPPSPSLQTTSKKLQKYFFPELSNILTNRISVNFENVDAKYILNFLRSQINIPVIISPNIPSRNISISAKDSIIYNIISSILRLTDIYLIYDGNTISFLNYNEYEKILKENYIETRVYDIRFINPKEIKEMIKPFLSQFGESIVDIENNLLVVKDIFINFEEIERFLKNIGVSPKLVMIKVEIIQIDRKNTLDYGFDLTLDNVIKSITSISFQGSPANISGTGIFGIQFSGNVESGGIISGIIKTLSTYGDVKLLSSPRVVCRNGQKAKILIGDKIPYIKSIIQDQSQNPSTTSQIDFIEAGIKLEVEPRITIQGEIAVDVKVGISSYRFIDLTTTLKAPQINTTEGEIKTVVKDGVPLVIGGLEKTTEILKKSGIPLLIDIPIVGDIFSSISKETARSTILIILTPEIIDYSIPQQDKKF